MDYLARESSGFNPTIWENIDDAVVSMAKKTLTGRRFLNIFGPLGVGIQSINIDEAKKAEEDKGGIIVTKGRKYQEIPLLYEDFTLFWKDMEGSERLSYPLDLSAAVAAAQALSKKEDELIFLGNKQLGYEGLLNAEGVNKIKKGNWKEGEEAFNDLASGISLFAEKSILGNFALILSPDLYLQLQRIQPGTGLLEIDRLSKLVGGNIFKTTVMGAGKAVLVCSEPQYMDLVLGQDMITSYLELKDMNHSFRILETALLRIKNRDAVIVFE